MAENLLELTDDNFQSEVVESGEPVLVDFWAPWCGPCRQIAPLVEELAGTYTGSVKFGKVNIDENPGAARKYGILTIPSLLLFKGGEVVDTLVGLQSKDRLTQAIEKAKG